VICNDKIYYYGGYSSKLDKNLVDLFCLDPSKIFFGLFLNFQEQMTFTQLASGKTCPEPRRGMSLFQQHNHKLYIFGGKKDKDTYFNNIYSYDLSSIFQIINTK